VAMWGYPLWSFAPLAALMWLGPTDDPDKVRRFAKGFLAVFVAFPLVYAAIELFEPAFRDRPKATQFPGQRFADIVTAAWHAKYGTPLTYVAGAEFPVNNLAVYSPDRPHVVVHGRPSLSPWIDMNDLRRRGAVIAWEGGPNGPEAEQWPRHGTPAPARIAAPDLVPGEAVEARLRDPAAQPVRRGAVAGNGPRRRRRDPVRLSLSPRCAGACTTPKRQEK
jgi:hypothetical protein